MHTTRDVDRVLAAVEAAWMAGDTHAFGALFTPTATYTAFDGTVMTGPEEIAEGHRVLFGGIMRGSKMSSWDRKVRLVSNDVAVAIQKGGIIMRWQGRATPSPKRVSANTWVLVKRDGKWLVEAFHNTRYSPWSETAMGRFLTRIAPKQ